MAFLAVNKEWWGVEVELNKKTAKKVWASSNRFSLRVLILHTVNVDCVKFEYVVLAKYHHMLIFEFDLLTKQHILILCKKLI
jgi:hypothetical protein